MATTVYNNVATNSNLCSTGNRADRYRLYLQITENSYDITTNKSNVSYVGWIQGTTTVTTFYGYPMSGTISQGGTTLASGSATATSSRPVSSANAYTLASGSSDFTHNSDGSLTISLTFSYSSTSPQATGGSVSTSLTLTKIPRASTIVAIDCDIESATSITINKADSAFTTTLAYSFTGTTNSALTGTIVEKTANTTYGWTVPSSFYAKIPDTKTGVCTLTATTYNGNTAIGTSTTTFKVTANEELCKPTGSLTVVDNNSTTTGLTGDSNKIVIGQSNAYCTITKSARNSATITSVKINGEEIGTSASTYTINKTNTNVFTLTLTDSRNYVTAITVTKTLVNYIQLTCKGKFLRHSSTDGIVNLSYNGNYFNSSFGTTNNTLTVKYRYKESGGSWSNWVTLSPTKSSNTYSQNVQLSETYIYNKAFDFELQAADKLTTLTITDSITQGIPIYWWDKESFNIEVDAYIKGSAVPTLDLVYPIGSIYITVNNTNPANLFGGTWEQIRDRFLLAAGTNYPINSIGGSSTHTHTLGNGYAQATYIWLSNENRLVLNRKSVGAYTANRYTTTAAPSYTDQNLGGITDAISLGGNTDSSSNMPPYIAVYVWKRIS